MHFVITMLNFAQLVYYRIQWENSRRPKTLGHHYILKKKVEILLVKLLAGSFQSYNLNMAPKEVIQLSLISVTTLFCLADLLWVLRN